MTLLRATSSLHITGIDVDHQPDITRRIESLRRDHQLLAKRLGGLGLQLQVKAILAS
jgi:hypothetical protein